MQRTDRTIVPGRKIENDAVRMKVRVGKCLAIGMFSRPAFTMAERRRSQRNFLDPFPAASTAREGRLSFQQFERLSDSRRMDFLNRLPNLHVTKCPQERH